MINISDTLKTALNGYGRELKCKVIFTDKTFEGDAVKSFKLDDSILTADEFEIGTFISATGQIEFINALDYKFAGKEFELQLGAKTSKGIEYVSLGLFTITDVQIKDRLTTCKFIDRATLFDKTYETTLSYPNVVLNIVKEVCTKLNITLDNNSFTNYDLTIDIKPTFKDDDTYRYVIAKVAELAGGYAKITNTGKLKIFNIEKYGANSIYTGQGYTENTLDRFVDTSCIIGINRSNYFDLKTAENETETISKVIVKTGSIASEIGNITGKAYTIVNNPFIQNAGAVISSIYNKISGISYKNLTCKWAGNLVFEVGDKVTTYDTLKLHNSYVMNRTINFNGGLTEEFKAPGKIKSQSNETKGNLTTKVENNIVEIINAKDQIKTKVAKGEDFINEVVIASDKLQISLGGKLQGKTYEFNGESFVIGGNDGDVARHSNDGSYWRFGDGSVVAINSEGFYNYFGSTRREYHHLNYNTRINKTAKMVMVDTNARRCEYTEYIYLDLPQEFVGKYTWASADLIYYSLSIASIIGTMTTWAVVENNKIKVCISVTAFPTGYADSSGTRYVTLTSTPPDLQFYIDVNLIA